jgi:4-amino-4-deoxy-L-arabinose transferase-like glycosyltransferase
MNLVVGALVVLVTTAVTVTTMLLVRRKAPEGSWFSDGDRASGVFGVLATGFSVILGFIIFLSFEAYDNSRAGAEDEATTVVQQVETAQFLPAGTREQLTGELVCYGRSVVGPEWKALETGSLEDSINPWGIRMFETIKAAHPRTSTEQSAYDRWMDQTTQREQGRNARVHVAQGVIPTPLWLALFAISLVIFCFMLFFADAAEGWLTQSMLMGSVTVVITMLLLLLVFFDHPHGQGVGQLRPTAMERSLRLIDVATRTTGVTVTPPCDARGVPR